MTRTLGLVLVLIAHAGCGDEAVPGCDPDATCQAPSTGSTDSDGGGRTQRSGRLLATLSVRVVEVGPQGELLVQGRQDLRINGETQSISLSGLVRPRDVAENNTVPSSRIADARVEFDGEGFVSDKSRPGWTSRLLAALGL